MEIILGICLLAGGIFGYNQYDTVKLQNTELTKQNTVLNKEVGSLSTQNKTLVKKMNDSKVNGADVVNLSEK